MAFRKFLSALGVNAPEVETVLDRDAYRPGERANATVTLRGGGADVEIARLGLDVVTRFEDMEPVEGEWTNPGVVVSQTVAEGFELGAGREHVLQVPVDLPWETPLTHVLGGRRLRGGRVAVRTELSIDGAVDRGDFDEFAVHTLPAQDLVLAAFGDLGFRFDEAEVKKGTPKQSVASRVNYWQEIEMWFPPEYGYTGAQLEFVFNAREDAMDLLFGNAGRLTLAYAGLDAERCRSEIDAYSRSLFQR
ncbi:sporulation protein [Streptomyces sp. DSM 42041]|uniref:Sporulation protein n=1 Tax=Streptomyces hazeniae TaxID=3075538 RepID=A0ABU2NS44_9ACTN|nr:sporulation protein [Streptomyces sp. DSM 42041]MDT0379800.1 sporulation protein [Streptomyces sp. DSM 42041]